MICFAELPCRTKPRARPRARRVPRCARARPPRARRLAGPPPPSAVPRARPAEQQPAPRLGPPPRFLPSPLQPAPCRNACTLAHPRSLFSLTLAQDLAPSNAFLLPPSVDACSSLCRARAAPPCPRPAPSLRLERPLTVQLPPDVGLSRARPRHPPPQQQQHYRQPPQQQQQQQQQQHKPQQQQQQNQQQQASRRAALLPLSRTTARAAGSASCLSAGRDLQTCNTNLHGTTGAGKAQDGRGKQTHEACVAGYSIDHRLAEVRGTRADVPSSTEAPTSRVSGLCVTRELVLGLVDLARNIRGAAHVRVV
jgi:hypothetical protein